MKLKSIFSTVQIFSCKIKCWFLQKPADISVMKRNTHDLHEIAIVKRANNILTQELEIPCSSFCQCNDKYSKDVEWRTGIWVNNSVTCFFIAPIPCHHKLLFKSISSWWKKFLALIVLKKTAL